jgi:hypothetical protein
MAKAWRPDLDSIPIDETLTLVVGWKKGRRVEARHVRLTSTVRRAIREACKTTLEHLRNSNGVTFGPDAVFERDEFLAVPRQVVAEDANELLAHLDRAAGLETVDPDAIPKLWFYSAVVGNEAGKRTAFVRKTDPHLTARPGWVISSLGEALSRIDDPVFVLESRFDVIVLPDGLAVLNATPFETLFRAAEEMSERVVTWADAITDHFPIAGDGESLLVDAARRSSRLAKRMRSIYDSGHLAAVTLSQLRAAAKQQGLDVASLFSKDGLVINKDTDTLTLLALLNEDLFKGGLTGTKFAADRKRAV